jgi:hypothetical protein
MDDEKKSVKDEVEDTMACTAFAEAGEPCPVDEGKDEGEKKEGEGMSVEDTMACTAFAEAGEPCPLDKSEKKEKDTVVDVEGTMACTAFAEAGEPCPIDTDKKKEADNNTIYFNSPGAGRFYIRSALFIFRAANFAQNSRFCLTIGNFTD